MSECLHCARQNETLITFIGTIATSAVTQLNLLSPYDLLLLSSSSILNGLSRTGYNVDESDGSADGTAGHWSKFLDRWRSVL